MRIKRKQGIWMETKTRKIRYTECRWVLWIREILLRHGSASGPVTNGSGSGPVTNGSGSGPMTNGSGSGSWSCYFRPTRCKQKTVFFLVFLLITFLRYIHLHNFSKIKFLNKSQNSRNPDFFILLFAWWWKDPDPYGTVSMTNGSGWTKNIRIRIHNTGVGSYKYHSKKERQDFLEPKRQGWPDDPVAKVHVAQDMVAHVAQHNNVFAHWQIKLSSRN